MNQRVSRIKHPAGFEITTPLLIPSFSSKGFAIDENGKSELCTVMDFTKEFIYESQLVSAYDIYYGHVPPMDLQNKTQITFIDSGGYETSNNYDLSETRKYERSKNRWDRGLHEEVVKGLDDLTPAALVSFDHVNEKESTQDQIVEAHKFFEKKRSCLSDFLVKPPLGQNFIQINELIQTADELRHFNIIGLTEKELGESMGIRLKNILSLRRSLDHRGIASPIHIFGALDPISVIHYFLAGAEIFDGLSWLKYAYRLGCATYINNAVVLETGAVLRSDNDLRLEVIKDNIYALERLKSILTEFTITSDYGLFDGMGIGGLGSVLKANLASIENINK